PFDAALADAALPEDAGAADDAGSKPTCRKAKTGERVRTIASEELTEASGLVASRAHPGVLWLHNDSGDGPRLFALTEQGALLGEVTIEGAQAHDWEDIALGSGPEAGKSYLYIADTGDNGASRDDVQIYRVEEPALDAHGKPTSERVKA